MKKKRTVAARLPEHMVRDLELVEEVEQTDRATTPEHVWAAFSSAQFGGVWSGAFRTDGPQQVG
ncbi:MAG TPA: hypothetical protein VGD06_09695 [Acidobacteriota bacterium]|jgi:hypothetical protein